MITRSQSPLFEHILRRSLLISLPALLAIAGCGAPDEISDIDDDESTVEATSLIVESTASAEWGAYKPRKGDLCQAAENIQFYDNYFNKVYVVQQNGNIRIDLNGDLLVDWTEGHEHNHATRSFKYRSTNGTLRLKNCH